MYKIYIKFISVGGHRVKFHKSRGALPPQAPLGYGIVLTCIIVNSDSPHGGLFEDGGLFVRNHLADGGVYEGA